MCSSMFTPGGGGTGTAENTRPQIQAGQRKTEGWMEGSRAKQDKTIQTSMNDGQTMGKQ